MPSIADKSVKKARLKRALNLPQLVLYGLGTTIGAGIYALIGELAGIAGYHSLFAFLIAAIVAFITALSFAEMASRVPKSGGSASFVYHGFANRKLSTTVGLLVIFAGLASTSALLNAFHGYLDFFIDAERIPTIILVMLVIAMLSIWGIAQSVTVAALITLIEVAGLIMIIWVSTPTLIVIDIDWLAMVPQDSQSWGLVFAGAVLAFYTFIGFEDMVVVAEETKDARRTLPLAIILTLSITSLLYLMVMLAAIAIMTPETLSQSSAPLAQLYQQQTGSSAQIITFIGMVSILNGALIQIIMASRVLYGMASTRQIPKIFAQIQPSTQTPLFSTLVAVMIGLVLAIIGTLSSLAQLTSLIMLVVFAVVNLALLMLKRRDHKRKQQNRATRSHYINLPFWLPLTGFITSLFFIGHEFLRLI